MPPNKVILSLYAIVTLREAKKLLDLGGKRRRVPIGLNQGEAKNALAKAVFFNRLGEMRDRNFENQRYRASGRTLMVAAIVLWNTVYLSRAIDDLKAQGLPIDDDVLEHLSPPAGNTLISPGDYVWRQNRRVESGKFRASPTRSRFLTFRERAPRTTNRQGLKIIRGSVVPLSSFVPPAGIPFQESAGQWFLQTRKVQSRI